MENLNIENNVEIEELKKEINDKNKKIEVLVKEIDNYKMINNKIMQENIQLKEKIQLIQNEQDDGLIM